MATATTRLQMWLSSQTPLQMLIVQEALWMHWNRLHPLAELHWLQLLQMEKQSRAQRGGTRRHVSELDFRRHVVTIASTHLPKAREHIGDAYQAALLEDTDMAGWLLRLRCELLRN